MEERDCEEIRFLSELVISSFLNSTRDIPKETVKRSDFLRASDQQFSQQNSGYSQRDCEEIRFSPS
ncbi:hypothetical protein KIN20_004170 [Parelaphostrongylus tenuis]|uniref:Uncharacterized protein n=1 Tax=Parelaphostrongylus tenuis TaxID=148309 RepID=A0AAD5QE89_PARTN|nr:hypothetical protein KIN20_004170 [Parelaphostrongylus tenuis]